jgi:hypothetical protein
MSGLISFILFVNLQLMKKIVGRMQRVNSYVQMQASFLVIIALILTNLVSEAMNFNTQNTAQYLNDTVPEKFHQKFYFISYILIAISLISFVGSYKEV